MPKVFTSETQKNGKLVEEIAVFYLVSKGYKIIERNYYKSIGEVDIIAQKEGELHFIEVKSVSHETNSAAPSIRAEDNFTDAKQYKFKKIITFYLAEKGVSHETNLYIDLICVYIDKTKKEARVETFWNVIL